MLRSPRIDVPMIQVKMNPGFDQTEEIITNPRSERSRKMQPQIGDFAQIELSQSDSISIEEDSEVENEQEENKAELL